MKQVSKKSNKVFCLKQKFFLILFIISVGLIAQEPSFLNITDLSGAFVLKYELFEENYIQDDNFILDQSRSFIEGGVQLNTAGSIYHPNLLEFNVSLNLVGYKGKNTFFYDSDINNSVNNTHNILLKFLNNKSLKFNLYSRSDFVSYDRAFADRYFTKISSTGGNLVNSSKFFPFIFDFFHLKSKTETVNFVERAESSDNLRFRTELIKAKNLTSRFRLKTKDLYEEIRDFSYRTLEILNDFNYNYGKSKRDNITAMISYRKIDRAYNIDNLNFNLNARNFLKKNLILRSNYSFELGKENNRSNVRNNFKVLITHKLFSSFSTTLTGEINILDSPVQDIDVLSTGINLGYQKKIKNGSISIGYQIQNNRGKFLSKSNDLYESTIWKFPYSDSIVLTKPGIEINSLIITSPDMSRVYLEGIDYQVFFENYVLIISRLPGGLIPAEARVLINYNYQPQPDHNSVSEFTAIDMRVNFLKYLSVHYMKRQKNENVTSDYYFDLLGDFNNEQYGVGFKSKLLNVEYYKENYISPLSTYSSDYYKIFGGFTFFRIIRISGNLIKRNTIHELQGFTREHEQYLGTILFRPLRFATFDFSYRHIKFQTRNFFNFRKSLIFKVNLSIRNIFIDIFYEYLLESQVLLEKNRSRLNVLVRRSF